MCASARAPETPKMYYLRSRDDTRPQYYAHHSTCYEVHICGRLCSGGPRARAFVYVCVCVFVFVVIGAHAAVFLRQQFTVNSNFARCTRWFLLSTKTAT